MNSSKFELVNRWKLKRKEKMDKSGIALIPLIVTIIVVIILSVIAVKVIEEPRDEEISKIILSIANEPVLGEGMKAVYWTGENGTGETEKANYTSEMYDYKAGDGKTDSKDSKWANAKTPDGSYWVWIPRYAYKITYYIDENKTTVSGDKTQYGDIDILFMYGTSDTKYRDIDGKPQDLPTGYKVHPAFQKMTATDEEKLNPLGKWDNELEGIWVAKYEASREDSTDGITWTPTTANHGGGDVLTTNAGNTSTTKSRIVSKPSVTSWKSISESNIYQNSLKMYENLNSHEMKNSEWGAVTYLTYSPYGRNGNELAVNQCTSYYIGGEPGTGSSKIYNSTYSYDAITFASTYAWNTEQGKLESTTGNIYGIYGMSGGADEYVASYVNNGHIDITGVGGVLGTTTDLKTKQVYPSTVTDGSSAQSVDYNLAKDIYGDAVYETSTNSSSNYSWCSDNSYFPRSWFPFFVRGGCYDMGGAGEFGFYFSGGLDGGECGFRPVLCVVSGT